MIVAPALTNTRPGRYERRDIIMWGRGMSTKPAAYSVRHINFIPSLENLSTRDNLGSSRMDKMRARA